MTIYAAGVAKKRRPPPPITVPKTDDDLIYGAWTLIANAYGGDWSKAAPEWRYAAEWWRDAYHHHIDG